jgi:uncharacterized membrane protein
VEVFSRYDGKIVQSTLDEDIQKQLQHALDSHKEEATG